MSVPTSVKRVNRRRLILTNLDICSLNCRGLTAYLTAYPGQSVTFRDTLWHKRVRQPRT